MQFISASLGVDCEFCHLLGKFELDDNQHKLTARKMIAMTLSINKDSFDGHTEVTCNSCHRGKTDPVATPPLDNGEVKPPAPVAQASPAGATAAQILEK